MASGLSELRLRGRRLTLICELIATFSDAVDRKNAIMGLWEARLVSPDTGQMLIEHFSLEAV